MKTIKQGFNKFQDFKLILEGKKVKKVKKRRKEWNSKKQNFFQNISSKKRTNCVKENYFGQIEKHNFF